METREICEKLKRAKSLLEDVEYELKSMSDMRDSYRGRDTDYRGRYGY